MRTVLKAKSIYDNADVAAVWAGIQSYVTEDEAWDAVEQAIAEVRSVVGNDRDRVVYGWSGGKDSLALQAVMERAGIRRAVLGTIPAMEWHQYLEWVNFNQPDGLTTIPNYDLDLRWLSANPRFLFPRDHKAGYRWTLAGTRRAQLRYQAIHKPIMQIYGRRRADGNVIGQEAYGIQRSRNLVAYNPLRDWSHELVLAVIHYARLELPPVYDWPHGWTAGTGAWPGRRIGTIDESWAETWQIEPDRVREAAAHIGDARRWMAETGVS